MSRGTSRSTSRYTPPANVDRASIAELLQDMPSRRLDPKQMSFLEAGQLYLAGDVTLVRQPCIAIIGARKASDLGRQRARQLARHLVAAGVVIVSGLADGIDTEALTAAIDAGGRVVAVIGTPLDQAYPAKNKALQELIYREHLLVSQFAPGTRVYPSHFPARNRTMAALTDASVVMEASDTSGTLHQAAECQRLGRWLGIARSVINDPALTWPAKFLDYPRTVELESTSQLLGTIYPEAA